MSNAKEYYGGFFWLAVFSFIVPLFVAYRAFDKLSPTSKPEPQPDVSGVGNEIWDYLLKNNVENGLVNYDGIKQDFLFAEYIRELGTAKPELLPSDAHRLALLCNAYNAFVINGVITHKKPEKVNEFQVDGVDFFNLKEHIFGGATISLNELEHQLIRPVFNDPRVHVALVCAARSCPAIRAEAFRGPLIDRQLDDQSAQFANNKKYVNFNPESSQLELSPILKWYGDDWNEKYPNGGYLQWISDLVRSPELKGFVDQAIVGDVSTTFLEYDWSLNSQSPPGVGEAGGKHSGSFGSGSIPNE